MLDQDDDGYDEIEEINRLHKRSESDTNFDSLFNLPRNGYNKDDHDDSSSSHSGRHIDKDSNADNDFKIFLEPFFLWLSLLADLSLCSELELRLSLLGESVLFLSCEHLRPG